MQQPLIIDLFLVFLMLKQLINQIPETVALQIRLDGAARGHERVSDRGHRQGERRARILGLQRLEQLSVSCEVRLLELSL